MNQRGSVCTTEHTQLYPADEIETQLQGIVNVGETMKKESKWRNVLRLVPSSREKRSGQQEKP